MNHVAQPWKRKEVIGNATLYLGDCLEILPTLPKVDAVITDPPYGVDFIGKATKHTKTTHTEPGGYIGGDSNIGPSVVSALLERCDRAIVFPGNRLLFDYPKPYEMGAVYCPSGAGLGRWGFTVFHPMLFYGMGLPETRQGPAGFESFDTQQANGHPCPKPVKWMRWAIAKCTREGMTVLDPFMGSGTTGVAAHETNRQFIGIEIEPKYFDIACERITNAQRQQRMFA
jgi:site-specific DNA-methyltransferase (adenine-specific)